MNKRESLANAKEILSGFYISANKVTIFVSHCQDNMRATVWNTTGRDFDRAWVKVERYLNKFTPFPSWIKLDLVIEEHKMSPKQVIREFYLTERNNYFNKGIRFKKDWSCAFLPEEIVGNALLTPHKEHVVGKNSAKLQLNEQNILGYMKRKYKKIVPNLSGYFDAEWCLFKTQGVFIENFETFRLESDFFGQGIREITQANQNQMLDDAIVRGGKFLVNQIQESGRFVYGYFPAYGKVIPGYNSVRHYSSLYALLELSEYLTKHNLKEKEKVIERVKAGIDWGLANLTLDKGSALYVKEPLKKGLELKLGAQAMIILTLSKYESLTGSKEYHEKMMQFIEGIHTFIAKDGTTTHVLDADLGVKERFRIIYYDGEALFAIMRAYPLVQDKALLELGELLMSRFIKNRYERYHDHWLSYSVNELTAYVPKKEYFEFGVKNALQNLKFIEHRDTAYPTMLELLVAAAKMFARIKSSEEYPDLITEEERQHLLKVMEKRVFHELRTGTMWSELAMYFANPQTIAGGFYARHDRCRMRIDDAEHFLSGLINYDFLCKQNTFMIQDSINAIDSPDRVKPNPLKFSDFTKFTGEFLNEEIAQNILIDDFEYSGNKLRVDHDSSHLGFIAFTKERINSALGVSRNWQDGNLTAKSNRHMIEVLITEHPILELADSLPQFIVPDSWEFMHEVSEYFLKSSSIPRVAITGSVGKSSTRLMIEHLLNQDYQVLSNRRNNNIRFAMPLYMTKLAQSPDILNLEISLNALNNRGKGPQSTLIQPTIAVLTSIGFAHMSMMSDINVLAKLKANVFRGLVKDGTAIINKDIPEEQFQIAYQAAKNQTDNILTYSMTKKDADLYLVKIKELKYLTEVTISYMESYYTYYLSLSSEGIVENSLASILILTTLGLDIDDYLPYFANYKSLPKVMEQKIGTIDDKKVDIIDDTHNAAIPSMINAIKSFTKKQEYYSGKKILALGQIADLGKHAQELHQKLVPYIENSGADLLLAYGDAMKEVVSSVNISASWYESMPSYVSAIRKEIEDNSLILLKGSVSESDYNQISKKMDILLSDNK